MLSLDSIATTKRIVEYIESDICPGLSLSGQLPLSGWLFQKHAPYFIQRRMSQLKYICFPLGLSCSCSYGDIVGNMLGKILLIGSVVAAIALVFLLNQTTPNQAGPLGVLVIFLLMYVLALVGVTFAIHGGSRLIAKFSASLTVKRPFRVVSLKRSYYYASIIALAPVMLIGMQSVSGINVYDVLLVIFFVLIGVVYISRRMP